MRSKDIDELILSILGTGTKGSSELLEQTKNQLNNLGDQRSITTIYRHIRKLVKQGQIVKIERLEYELPTSRNEVDSKEAEQIIELLKEENDPEVLRLYSESFYKLFNKRRGAGIPSILSFIHEALKTPKFQDPETLRNIIQALYSLLFIENQNQKIDKVATAKLVEFIDEVKQAMLALDNQVIGVSLNFLAETREAKAVCIIINLALELPDKLYSDLEATITQRLFNSDWHLYGKYSKLIIEEIYCMIKSNNPAVKKRGLSLERARQSIRMNA